MTALWRQKIIWILCTLSFSSEVLGLEYYVDDQGEVRKDIVVSEGKQYALVSLDTMNKISKDKRDLELLKKKASLLESQLTIKTEQLKIEKDIRVVLEKEIELSHVQLSRYTEVPKTEWYRTYEVGLVSGVVVATLSFFIWRTTER